MSRFNQSYAAFKSIKHRKGGLDEIFIEFCRIKIASVIDRFDLQPNWEFDINFPYAFLILAITKYAKILKHVEIIERPL